MNNNPDNISCGSGIKIFSAQQNTYTAKLIKIITVY